MSEQTLDQIKAKLATAIATGDDNAVMTLSRAIMQFASDIKKAEVEKLRHEAEALAGQREKIEAKLYRAILKILNTDELLAVKAKGFHFTVDHLENDKGQLDPNGQVAVTGACKLTVPTIKATKASTGSSGGTGITVESQTGLKRSALIDRYATDEEKATLETVRVTAEEEGKNANSATWAASKPVVKRILQDHPELIRK